MNVFTPQGVKNGYHTFKKGALTYRLSDEDLAVIVGYSVRENKIQRTKLNSNRK